MTIEEAIKTIEIAIANVEWNYPLDYAVAFEMAISALRAQQEVEEGGTLKTTWETPESCPHCMEHLSKDWSFCPECGRHTDWSENKPLAMEELREMEGKPVWVTRKDGSGGRWGIINIYPVGICADVCSGTAYWFEDFIGTMAYRHKPKEKTI